MAAHRLCCAEVLDQHLHRRKRCSLAWKPILVDCNSKLRAGLPESLLLQSKTCAFLETESCRLALLILYHFTDLKTIIKSFFQPSPRSVKQQLFIRHLLYTRHCARPWRRAGCVTEAGSRHPGLPLVHTLSVLWRDVNRCFAYTHFLLCQMSFGHTGLNRILYHRTLKL